MTFMSLDHVRLDIASTTPPRHRSPPRWRGLRPLRPGQVAALKELAISAFVITPAGWRRADGIAMDGPSPRTLITLEERGLLRFTFHDLGRRARAQITHQGRAALGDAGAPPRLSPLARRILFALGPAPLDFDALSRALSITGNRRGGLTSSLIALNRSGLILCAKLDPIAYATSAAGHAVLQQRVT